MHYDEQDDYRYSDEARSVNLMFHWKCDDCGHEYSDYPGINEGGKCSCGGRYRSAGESYDL